MTEDGLPRYEDLPVRDDHPPGSAWGVFGDRDEIGTLNLLSDARTLAAARALRYGRVFPLSLPLEEPDPRLGSRRQLEHHVLDIDYSRQAGQAGRPGPLAHIMARDDYLDGLWLQASSQWDGLAHIRHRLYGNYNGVPDEDIRTDEGARLGIDRWAARAVVGRGVLVDVQRWLAHQGRPIAFGDAYEITVDDLSRTLEHQKVEVRTGDVLLVHTGWLEQFRRADAQRRRSMTAVRDIRAPGLEPSDEMVAFLWNLHVAAVAADNPAVEVFPPRDPERLLMLHTQWLPLLGMPIGELWTLDALAAHCDSDRVYEVLVVSVPLNVRGAVGSPAQAVAIK